MDKFAIFIMAAFLYGCAAGPSGPKLRTSADSEGALITGCLNVSEEDDTRDFITNYYLTTWGSATTEGLADDFIEGLEKSDVIYNESALKRYLSRYLPSPNTFCMAYEATPEHIFLIIAEILPQFGYDFKVSSKEAGFIETDFVLSSHQSVKWKCIGCTESQELLKPAARWKDRYFISIDQGENHMVVVKIFRDLYISRRTGDKWSTYNRAISVGHNEAVIINRIKNVLYEKQ